MDPVCHTLVGATLGCTGLEKTTRYSRATLIVGANLPDIDVIAHFMDGTASYAFRRGITHGIPALIVLPALLAIAVLAWHRLFASKSDGPPLSARWLLILSLIAVWTHPLLDWMNTYGMRWLMPMINEWYYGDTLFIIDWIVWLVLMAALIASRARFSKRLDWYARPASLALGFLVGYIVLNFGITRLAERTARTELSNDPPVRMLASPVPFDPRHRQMVLEYENEYRLAEYRFGAGDAFLMQPGRIPKGSETHLRQVAATKHGAWFLHWARFPYSVIESIDGERYITVADARYVPDLGNQRLDGFAVFRMKAPAPPVAVPSPD